MGKKEDFDSIARQITAIGDDEIEKPHNIPVYVYISEADLLHRWAMKDKEQLIAAGLDWSLVESLPVRTRALTEAEARWGVKRKTTPPCREEWNTLAPQGMKLRDNLLHRFRFAFRNQRKAVEILKHIAKGKGYADAIQDFEQLLFLARGNEDLLTATGFDPALLEEAENTARRMTALFAEVTAIRKEQDETLTIRNQAYTYLKQAVDEIRCAGRFALHQNKHRLAGYRSQYLQRINTRNREKNKNTAQKNTPEKP